jgi:hypothetical protein
MLRELRMFWRLRPYIAQLKGIDMGKFSIHMVFQVLFVLVGALTEIFDLLPAETQKQTLIVLVLAASVLGLYNHFKNPDGTSAALPYEKKLNEIKRKAGIDPLRFVGILLIPAFLCLPAMAQSDAPQIDRVAFVGAGYFDGAQAKGLTGFVTRLEGRVYNITEMSVGMVPVGTGNINLFGKDLQSDFSSGVLYAVADYKGFSLFGLGDAGLQQSGGISSAMFKAGGGFHKFVYKDLLGLAVFGTWKYSQDPVTRVNQWKANPAAALTVRF